MMESSFLISSGLLFFLFILTVLHQKGDAETDSGKQDSNHNTHKVVPLKTPITGENTPDAQFYNGTKAIKPLVKAGIDKLIVLPATTGAGLLTITLITDGHTRAAKGAEGGTDGTRKGSGSNSTPRP